MRPAMDRQLAGLRIGAYARFSSDKQSETSATAQIARLQQWVQARGGQLSLEHTYRDEGISGATNQRPGLISLMAAVDSRELDVVVVEDLSRLSRDIEHSASMRKRFAFSGVRLIGIADGIDTLGNGGDLLYGVKSILSEQYLKDLGDKTSRGLRDRAQIGRVTGALPYGYTSATAPDGQGKVPGHRGSESGGRSTHLPDESGRAELPRHRQDPQRRRGRAAPRATEGFAKAARWVGHVWSPLDAPELEVRRSLDLRCSLLEEEPNDGEARRAARPSLRWSRSRCPSSASWTKRPGLEVQAINEEARERHATVGPSAYAREGGARTARRVYPLSTLIRCGVCGGPMVIEKTQKPRYRCDASRGNGGTCDNSRTVMEDGSSRSVHVCHAPILRPTRGRSASDRGLEGRARDARSAPFPMSEPRPRRRSPRLKPRSTTSSTSPPPGRRRLASSRRSVSSRPRATDRSATSKSWEPCSRHSTYRGPRTSSREFVDLGALFDKSPKDAREALKHLLDDGIQLHPLEDGRYRARWTVRGGALFFGGTTKPPVQNRGP